MTPDPQALADFSRMRDETLSAALTEARLALLAGTFPEELRPRLLALATTLHRRGQLDVEDAAAVGFVLESARPAATLDDALHGATLFSEIERLLCLHGPDLDAEVALEDIGLALLDAGRELEVEALQAIASGHRWATMLKRSLLS